MKDDDATTEGTTDGAASADPAAILETVATAVADCKSQTRLLEARKAALLVELGTVSDALEDVYNSRKQLEEMADDLLEDLSEVLSSDAHIEARQKFEAAVAMAQRPPDAQTIGQAKGAARPDQQKAHRQRVRKADKTQSKQAQHDARKAERLAALMPETAEAREALKRRQIVVRGLPPGAVDEAGLARVLCAVYGALSSMEQSSTIQPASSDISDTNGMGKACEAAGVQLYAGGSYAFVAMRDVSLAATAPLLPPIIVHGSTLKLTRVWEYESDVQVPTLSVPSGLQLSEVIAAALAADGPGARATAPEVGSSAMSSSAKGSSSSSSSTTTTTTTTITTITSNAASGGSRPSSLESKLYWSLRNHRVNPRPCEKEVQEALAFLKKCEKLLGRRRLVVDCCGSHGLIGALFVAFGRAQEAWVLDLHRPGSFDTLCDAWAPWLAGRGKPSDNKDRSPAAIEAAGAQSSDQPERQRTCAVRFETGDFQATLPALLDGFLAGGGRTSEICVVACHACTHLTDRIIAMCIERRVDFAVMPCCQRDTLTQGQLSIAAKDLGIREGEAIDIARLGSVVARGYDCRWRTIDKKITPVNRLLVGLANVKPNVAFHRQQVERNADAKMVQIYSRLLGMSPAHGPATPPPAEDSAAGEQEAAGTTLAARAGSEGQ